MPNPSGDEIYDGPANDLATIFAVALQEEPPSRVTADSVLREARAAREPSAFAEWLRTAGWRWGGGLVAAAALAWAVIALPPMTGGGSADSATMADAGAAPEMAYSDSAADDAAPADGNAGSESAGSDSAGTMTLTDQDTSARDDSASDTAASDDSADSEEVASADMAAAGAAADEPAEAPTADGGADSSIAVVGPPLTDAEWDAVTRLLPVPAERSYQVLRDSDSPVVGPMDIRIDRAALADPEAWIVIIAGPDTGPGHDYPGQTEPATVGDLAERYRHDGRIVVQSADGTTRVVVAATERALDLITEADLTRIAEAVRDAS